MACQRRGCGSTGYQKRTGIFTKHACSRLAKSENKKMFERGNTYGIQGRKPGSRNRISSQLLQIVFDHSQEEALPGSKRTKFSAALEIMYRQRPVEYGKLIASLLPKQVDIGDPTVADLN